MYFTNTNGITIRQVLDTGVVPWRWISAADACGLISCVFICICRLQVLWN